MRGLGYMDDGIQIWQWVVGPVAVIEANHM